MGRITVDEAVYKVAMQGVEKAKADINALAMTYANAINGMGASSAKGTAGLVANNKAISDGITKTSNTMDALGSAANNMGGSLEKTTGKAKGLHEEIKKGDSIMSKYIVRGMLMSIGWQAINNTMQFGINTVKSYFMANIELEVSMKSLEFVARKTGRSFAEVGSVINRNLDSMTDKATLTTAVMKLMATSLSTDDIDKWIKSVKAGSAAMGADFNEQVILQAKGFKQLTANILDNVGVTIYLDQVKVRAAKTYDTTVALLTEEQIHQQLLTEQLKQTAKFMGLWEEKMKTTQGAMERLSTSWKRFMQEIGDTSTIKKVSSAIAEALEGATTTMKFRAIPLDFVFEQKDLQKWTDQAEAIHEKRRKRQISSSEELQQLDKIKIEMLEVYNKVLLDAQKIEEERIATINMGSDAYKEQQMLLEENTFDLDRYTESTKALTDSISENDKKIRELTVGTADFTDGIYNLTEGLLPKYEQKLKMINEALKEQSNDLSKAESQIKDYQSQLDKKLKVFDPESLKQTEDYLKDIQKELLSITREEERNQKDMWKRVEPKLRKQIEEDQVRIQKEKGELLEEEKATRAKLLTEITELTVKLEEQKKVKEDILAKTIEIEGATYNLAEAEEYVKNQIQDIKSQVAELNTMNLFSKEKLNEDISALKETEAVVDNIQTKMDLLKTSAENANAEIAKLQEEAVEKLLNPDPFFPLPDVLKPKSIFGGSSSSRSSNKTSGGVVRNKNPSKSKSDSDLRKQAESGGVAGGAARAELDRRSGLAIGSKFVPETGLYKLHIGESVNTRRETDNKMSNNNGMTFQPGSIIIHAGNRSAESMFSEFERVARRKISRGARI